MPPIEDSREEPTRLPERWLTARRSLWIVAAAWAIMLLAVSVRVGWAPHRQSVYAADYARAGQHWLHGKEIYRESHHFLYSPLTAAMLVPFGLLPDAAGGIAWRLVSTGAFLAAAAVWLRSRLAGLGVAADPERGGRAMAAALLLLLPLTIGNVNIGQMNLLVFAVVAWAVLAVWREQWNVAALAMAAGGFLKIYPLAVGLLLVVLYPRKLLWRLAVAVGLLFAVSLLLQRPGYVWGEYRVWFERLGTDDRLDIGLADSWRDFGYLLKFAGLDIPAEGYRLMEAVAGGLLAAFCWAGQRYGKWGKERLLGAVLYLGCAWMVLFGPATEAATYVVLALPVCAAVVAAWWGNPSMGRKAGTALRVVLTAVYGLLIAAGMGNSWMPGGRHLLFLRTLQPVAALGFVVGIVWWLTRKARRWRVVVGRVG